MIDRRDFVKSSVVAAAALSSGATAEAQGAQARSFKLRYAPHFGMFREHAGADVVAQLEFMRAEGFTALEDNGMKGRPLGEQTRIAAAMERLGMRMGVFVAHEIAWSEPNLTTGDAAMRDAFLQQVRESIDVAKRVHATWMTVVPGYIDRRLDMSFQTSSVIEVLKHAAAILEPHGLVIVIEPLNTRHDHPGQFLTHVGQAHAICKAVGSPSCKILYDMYHAQITEGNIIPNMELAWSEIAYFQVGDNPGRKEPFTGEMNYRNIFRHIHGKGFTGVVGMEHGNS